MVTGTEDPVAVAAVTAIHTGDLAALRRLLAGILARNGEAWR